MALSNYSKPKLLLQSGLYPISIIALLFLNMAHSQDSTSFSFDSFGSNPTDLTYQGDAYVPSGSTSLYLTKNVTRGSRPDYFSVGRVLYSTPLRFWKPEPESAQASFQTTITFSIRPYFDLTPADGIAFFIAPVGTRIPSGSTSGRFGIFSQLSRYNDVFAVEFDVHADEWDPSFRHIGIDINSVYSSNVTRVDDDMVGQEVTARIGYDAETGKISVVASWGSKSVGVTHVYDLKSFLPQQVQVGISASTGRYVAFHDLHSWHFNSTLVRETANIGDAYIRQYV